MAMPSILLKLVLINRLEIVDDGRTAMEHFLEHEGSFSPSRQEHPFLEVSEIFLSRPAISA